MCEDDRLADVGERVANLALATAPGSRLDVCGLPAKAEGAIVLRLSAREPDRETSASPVIVLGPDAGAEGRFVAAFQAAPDAREFTVVIPAAVMESEHEAQSTAVRILDGLCAALSG